MRVKELLVELSKLPPDRIITRNIISDGKYFPEVFEEVSRLKYIDLQVIKHLDSNLLSSFVDLQMPLDKVVKKFGSIQTVVVL